MIQSSCICIVAAGSGGHILPAFTLARASKNILFFSSSKSLDAMIAREAPAGTVHVELALPAMPGKNLFRYPAYLFALAKCTVQALRVLRKSRPKIIISTGGQLGIPVCLAGKLLRIPIEVYELNSRPGRAMQVLSRLATRVHYVFMECAIYLPKKKRVHSEYPLRYASTQASGGNKILILGGSQGSRELNKLVRGLDLKNHSVIHQLGGQEDVLQWQSFYKKRGIDADVFSYRDNLQECYEQASFAIARSGAGTIFELLYFGIRAVLVPLAATTTSHQVHNARAIAREHPKLFHALGPRPTQEQLSEALAHLTRDRKSH